MNELTITVESQPKEEEQRKVIEGLVRFNESQTGDASYERFTVFLRDANNQVIGGLLGEVYWSWLHIDLLWIDDAVRKRGYGRRLLAAAEQEAVIRGCRSAFLDTFSFQAVQFYEKLGYEMFGKLEDFPPGHSRFFMRKSLKAPQ